MPIFAPSPRNHQTMAGVPVAARANHGALTISMKVSTTSFRQMKELQSGCSPERIRPTSSHLAATALAAAVTPATRTTNPPRTAATP